MSKPKKKEYWLEKSGPYFLYRGKRNKDVLWEFVSSFCTDAWDKTFAPVGSALRLVNGEIIKISITPTKTGFKLDAIGKAEKI